MASPAEEAQVREATRRVIQGVDLETVKEKQIVEMVEAQLGILLGDDEALMACLQEEIETFLLDDTAVAKAGPGQTKPARPRRPSGDGASSRTRTISTKIPRMATGTTPRRMKTTTWTWTRTSWSPRSARTT
jgi:hypothetical protein